MTWEPVIGLEMHVQLKTKTKMFCRCRVEYGAEPNTNTCPVCLGHPGALPVANAAAIEATIRLGLALGCEIAERAVFHRKNYFYRDLPKGYQISQYDAPLCRRGAFFLPGAEGDAEIGIIRAHLEEDAAKSVHVGGARGRSVRAEYSLVDFNRGGTPLVEIVTEPGLRSADEAKRFLQLLRQTVIELGISDAEMEKGTLRADANVSVRQQGESEYRTRTELKNMNSFNFIARGIEAEVARQIALYEAGGEVVQETYDFDPDTNELTPHRAKEEADDYRYFPDPDLVPMEPARELVERLGVELPELPGARMRRFETQYELPTHDAEVLNGSSALAALYENVVAAGADAKAASNVLMNQFAATGVEPASVDAAELSRLIQEREHIPRSAFTEALAASGDPGFSAERYLADGLVADTSELEPLVERILASNEEQVAAYRGGKEGLLGFFVGQVMKETQGKADPKVVNDLLREKLKTSA
jgi:aspartyl-tRNA(Asn)/glutamyl-tRNA(Gln) amidotransferase subunit B